jgi:hypothetical protein
MEQRTISHNRNATTKRWRHKTFSVVTEKLTTTQDEDSSRGPLGSHTTLQHGVRTQTEGQGMGDSSLVLRISGELFRHPLVYSSQSVRPQVNSVQTLVSLH